MRENPTKLTKEHKYLQRNETMAKIDSYVSYRASCNLTHLTQQPILNNY